MAGTTVVPAMSDVRLAVCRGNAANTDHGMRLLEAIMDANHRALSGDKTAGLRPDDHAEALPVVALTCIDPRLNPLVPEVFGVPENQFIWLRNAGNIITGPMSSTLRSLALACVVKHGREIIIVGHTDCLVCKTSVTQLIADFQSLGIPRGQLPENLHEYFGLFASERQNVIRAVDFVRSSPLIGPHIPVHGLMLDVISGRLEWVVNGYEKLDQTVTERPATTSPLPRIGETVPELPTGEIKTPDFKIGEVSPEVGKWLAQVTVPSTQPETMPDMPKTPPVLSTADLTKHFNQARRYLVVGSDHRVYGPILGTKVLEWIAESRLDWDSEARFENSNHWVKLSDLVDRRP